MERAPSGERMQDIYGSTRVRQQASILADFSSIQEDAQEEEAPVDWGRISKDLHSPERRRLSLQVDNLDSHKKESRRYGESGNSDPFREVNADIKKQGEFLGTQASEGGAERNAIRGAA